MGVYDTIKPLRPRRSTFNLSYEKKLTCDMGQLIPILCDEVIPGSTWRIGVEAVLRMLPSVAPFLHEVNVYIHYFFDPYRLLDSNFESFITGGVDGADAHTMGTWIPTHGDVVNSNGVTVKDNGVGSLWDYFGFPVTDAGIIPAGAYPLAFPRRAYNHVYNTYYRDQTQIAESSLDAVIVRNRAWEKDYVTSMLPWQQRGTAPSLPISGSSAAVWSTAPDVVKDGSAAEYLQYNAGGASNVQASANIAGAPGHMRAKLTDMNANTVSLATAVTFNVADIRLAFAIQKWMERNARGGARYVEYLQNIFGVSPKDERLQRPEYIGGTKIPLIVSEVLQTSESATTPQGTMAGHALAVGKDFCAAYHAEEYGLIIGIMSIMPRSAYAQGINRQWLRATRYDYYNPMFANLSEQAVTLAEVWATNTDGTGAGQNRRVIGYQGRYNEMRSKQSMLCGLMRYEVTGTLGKYWHVARSFGSEPALNQSLIDCVPRKDFLAAPTQPTFIVNINNIIQATLPMPVESDPGLIDHDA